MIDALLLWMGSAFLYLGVTLAYHRGLTALISYFVSRGHALPRDVTRQQAEASALWIACVWPLFTLILLGSLLWQMLRRKR